MRAQLGQRRWSGPSRRPGRWPDYRPPERDTTEEGASTCSAASSRTPRRTPSAAPSRRGRRARARVVPGLHDDRTPGPADAVRRSTAPSTSTGRRGRRRCTMPTADLVDPSRPRGAVKPETQASRRRCRDPGGPASTELWVRRARPVGRQGRRRQPRPLGPPRRGSTSTTHASPGCSRPSPPSSSATCSRRRRTSTSTCTTLPNLGGVNVVLQGLLGHGVAASTRFDPQAKGLGEWAAVAVRRDPRGAAESARSPARDRPRVRAARGGAVPPGLGGRRRGAALAARRRRQAGAAGRLVPGVRRRRGW